MNRDIELGQVNERWWAPQRPLTERWPRTLPADARLLDDVRLTSQSTERERLQATPRRESPDCLEGGSVSGAHFHPFSGDRRMADRQEHHTGQAGLAIHRQRCEDDTSETLPPELTWPSTSLAMNGGGTALV